MRTLLRWTYRTALVITALVGFSLLFSPVRDGVWAALFLADMAAGDNPSLFKRFTHPPTVITDTLVTNADAIVPFDLYQPPADKPTSALVFTHGLAHMGNRDPRVVALSLRLARAGFTVMAPDLLQMKTYKLGFQDVDALAASLTYLHGHPKIDATRIGILAPSFCVGPALIAISRPEIRDRVLWGLAFG